MKIKYYALFFQLSFSLLLIGQEAQYDQLFNQGKLPEDYTLSSYEKYLIRLTENNLEVDGTKEKDDERQFFLESSYIIDELLRSGYVLFNDPLGEYVNKVMDVIIANNPVLKERSPRAYILRSTAVNAFAVDQGIIFVSLGLLAQLENEAQLALILSHELVHVEEDHGLEGFLEALRIDQSLKKIGRINAKKIDISTLDKNRYSREQEIEADNKGLNYFLNTNYSFTSIHRVFDVLRYAYLPFDEITFDTKTLEKISVSIPKDYLLQQVQVINPAEEDEEQSTHPAISKRVNLLTQKLNGMIASGKQNYLISKESFQNIQMKSRFELGRLHLENQELPEAIYISFLLSEIYGESSFSKEIIGEALYGLTKFKNNKQYNKLPFPKSSKIEGESQQVFHILEKLTPEELNIVAIAYNYDRYREQRGNEVLRSLVIDLFAELYNSHDITSLNSFHTIPSSIDNVAKDKQAESEDLKIDRIIQTRKASTSTQWHLLAFSEVLSDTIFRNIAEAGFSAGEALKKERDYYDPYTQVGLENSKIFAKEIEKNGFSLGIDHVIVVNPIFIHLNGRIRNLEPGYIESDSRRESLSEIIHSSASINDVKIEILDTQYLKENDTEKLNHAMIINEWIDVQLDADDFIYQSYNQEEIEAIATRYDTPYFMSIGVISIKQNNVISQFLNRKTGSFIFAIVFDVRDGKRAFIKSNFLTLYINDALLKSEFYDVFSQLSKKN